MKNIKKTLEKLQNVVSQKTPMTGGPGACCYHRNGILMCANGLMLNDCQGFNGVFYSGQICSPNLCTTNKPHAADIL